MSAAQNVRDVVVTVPKDLWELWLEEGDLPGDKPTGEEWGFYTSGARPGIRRGDRVYVVAHGKLRGYAPLTRLEVDGRRLTFGREGAAVALTIPESIRGFRGWRYRWWNRKIETAFENWKTYGIGKPERRKGGKRGEGGPDSGGSQDSFLPVVDRVLDTLYGPLPEAGCRNCTARGVALLDPCMAVPDGGVHELAVVTREEKL